LICDAPPHVLTAHLVPQEHEINANSAQQSRFNGNAKSQRKSPADEVDQPTHELEKWKLEASTHKHAAHELAKAAKVAKQEALDARNRLDEERESAQRNREDANEVIDSLQKQMQAMNSSPSKVVSSSAEVGTLLAQVNDANYKHRNLMQEIKYKDDEISEIRRKAVYNTPNANSLDRTKTKKCMTSLLNRGP